MNEAVMQKAKELAQLIRYSPEYICMMAAQEAAAGEEALEAISREYDDKRRAVEDMTLADEPDYEQIMAGSRELEELQGSTTHTRWPKRSTSPAGKTLPP